MTKDINITEIKFGNNPLRNLVNLQVTTLQIVDSLADAHKEKIDSGEATEFDEAAYIVYSLFIRMQAIISQGILSDDEELFEVCSEALDFCLKNYAYEKEA